MERKSKTNKIQGSEKFDKVTLFMKASGKVDSKTF